MQSEDHIRVVWILLVVNVKQGAIRRGVRDMT
jgi:hypothetical protein